MPKIHCEGASRWEAPSLFVLRQQKRRRHRSGAAAFGVSLCVEHILQLFEEALALFVVLFFQGALKFLQGLTLGLVQLFGDLHLALDVHVATAAAVQVLDALAAQAEGGAALGALRHGVLHLAVDGRHR